MRSVSCPCGPAPDAFVDAYTKKFGQAPGTYSVEAYDAAAILLKGIDSGAVTRPRFATSSPGTTARASRAATSGPTPGN